MNEKLLIEKLFPSFRGKWQNLNEAYPDDAKLLVVAIVWAERKEWSKDELVSQLRPMCKLPFYNIRTIFLIIVFFSFFSVPK